MKYVDEYRDGRVARAIAATIAAEAIADRSYRFMEFCGGHTHAISRYGLEDLLPRNVRMIHGPGCPVCVLPAGRIDEAVALARLPGVTLCTYADLMRVPASGGMSLTKAKAQGEISSVQKVQADVSKSISDAQAKVTSIPGMATGALTKLGASFPSMNCPATANPR